MKTWTCQYDKDDVYNQMWSIGGVNDIFRSNFGGASYLIYNSNWKRIHSWSWFSTRARVFRTMIISFQKFFGAIMMWSMLKSKIHEQTWQFTFVLVNRNSITRRFWPIFREVSVYYLIQTKISCSEHDTRVLYFFAYFYFQIDGSTERFWNFTKIPKSLEMKLFYFNSVDD